MYLHRMVSSPRMVSGEWRGCGITWRCHPPARWTRGDNTTLRHLHLRYHKGRPDGWARRPRYFVRDHQTVTQPLMQLTIRSTLEISDHLVQSSRRSSFGRNALNHLRAQSERAVSSSGLNRRNDDTLSNGPHRLCQDNFGYFSRWGPQASHFNWNKFKIAIVGFYGFKLLGSCVESQQTFRWGFSVCLLMSS